MENKPVVIIGAGMAGLSCASYLTKAGWNCQILEAAEKPGGRIYTDQLDGFRLDRGFQVLQTAYPEAKKLLNYDALQLHTFRSGAMVRLSGKFVKLINPLREPLLMPQAVMSPVGSLPDKFHIMQLVQELNGISEETIWQEPPTSTIAYLSRYGWSEKMIKSFFQPFLGGVFLEKELITSSNFFRFVFQQFYLGDAALPANGMQAIPQQVADTLPPGVLQTNTPVRAIAGNQVILDNGNTLDAAAIVLATDAAAARELLNQADPVSFNQTTCFYFAAPASPVDSPMLVLNADSQGLINHLAVLSDIAPSYAPPDQSLVSVNVVGPIPGTPTQWVEAVRAELTDWFGEPVQSWRHLQTYHLPEALPQFTAEQPRIKSLKIAEDLYQCGDQAAYPSTNAAILTGRLVAEMISGTG